MPCQCPGCMKHVDFDAVAFYAERKCVDGVSTISLLARARNDRERAEIALAALIDLDDETFFALDIVCNKQCRQKLKALRERMKTLLAPPQPATLIAR
jgi:hypothetical protein